MNQASALLFTLCLGLAPLTHGPSLARELGPPARRSANQEDEASAALLTLLESQGLKLDTARGMLGVPVSVAIKHDLLEYLLVGPEGKGHESLLGTLARPSLVNAALLALGVEEGQNASWTAPIGDKAPELSLPSGDGFYLYLAWREAEESYFYRIEDVIVNGLTGRSMQRHKWVFLGSRFASARPGEPEVFVADMTQDLINVCFFYSKNTLLTAALPECQEQAIWSANAALLPPQNHKLQLILSRNRLGALPADWEQQLPLVVVPEPESGGEDGR